MKKQGMKHTILIVEDDEVLRETITEVFLRKGFRVLSAETGRKALDLVKGNKIHISLLDLRLPDVDGLTVLKGFQEIDDDIITIVVTAYPEVKTAIAAIKAGAYDYINKPFELEELKLFVDKALETRELKSEIERLRYEKGEDTCSIEMIGESPAFKEVKELIAKVARASNTPVLVRGETGTGKELVANAIHCSSDRWNKPFVRVNCSAIPDNLLESEMFGYEKGAFTDAKQSKKGLFELADGGTIFLDEIGDMDAKLQPKLLEVLELQSFRKVGGTRDIQVDVRVIGATNRDLEELVIDGKFRKDLYYRLNVIVVNLPPLREREKDILLLAEHFVDINSKRMRKNIKGISAACHDFLLKYPWPGNVRELKNIIERIMILTNSGEIRPEHLPAEIIAATTKPLNSAEAPDDFTTSRPSSLSDIERNYIMYVLREVGWNKSEASRRLGISRLTLREKLKKYAIEQGN